MEAVPVQAVPMQMVLDAATDQRVTIGHDGCAIPTDTADVMPNQCICDGSGYAEVVFAGRVIARPRCPACAEAS